MTRDEIVQYWIESAEEDFQAMINLFETGHNVWALFVGHLAIEKLLKAYYVKTVDKDIPWIHNLLKIAESAHLELSYEQRVLLDEITTFNTRARYPDYKKSFYKKASKEFTADYVGKVKGLREWLIEKLKS